MKYLIISILITLSLLLLCGCNQELKDGYQWGDVHEFNARKADEVHQHRIAYCSAYSTKSMRRLALAALRIYYPSVPKDGICIGLTTQEVLGQLPINHPRIRDGPD